jgi:hypothetical protein
LTFNKPLTFVPVAEGQAMGTPGAGAGSMTEGRNFRGFDPDGVAESEADYFRIAGAERSKRPIHFSVSGKLARSSFL